MSLSLRNILLYVVTLLFTLLFLILFQKNNIVNDELIHKNDYDNNCSENK